MSPNELEEVLSGVDGVLEVAVVGMPSPSLGEVPRAYVVPRPGVSAPSPQALKDYVAGLWWIVEGVSVRVQVAGKQKDKWD